MRKIYSIPLLLLSIFIISNCEEPIVEDDSVDLANTLEETSVGNGNAGALENYFYNFENEINVTFQKYSYTNLIAGTTPGDDDTLNFRTFPSININHEDYNPLDSDFSGYLQVNYSELDEEEKNSLFTPVELNLVEDYTIEIHDSIQVEKFKDITSLSWNYSLNRYESNTSEWIKLQAYVDTTDVYDIIESHVVIDTLVTPIHDVTLFVDTDQLVVNETEFLVLNDYSEPVPIIIGGTISYDRQEFSSDSLQYVEHCDCNNNAIKDNAEPIGIDSCEEIGGIFYEDGDNSFCDMGNGIWDDTEPFTSSESGLLYKDLNCNGSWDQAEPLNEAECIDGIWLEDEGFCDMGNGKWDSDESGNYYLDNGDFVGEVSDRPNNLVIDYTDIENPVIVLSVQCDSVYTTKHGYEFKIIETNHYDEWVQKSVDDIDYIQTVWTNRIIDVVEFAGSTDYYITKTSWEETTGREYDYHLFNQDEHIFKLEHPSYFLPDGAYSGFSYYSWDEGTYSPTSFVDGFWFEEYAKNIPLYYTYGGFLRDGEVVETDELVVTPIADYQIETTYSVESDSVTVPFNENTFFDTDACFKITRVLKMTMIGSGVEYGEKNITWLAQDYGIVKDEVYIRWTEPSWISSEQWFPYAKWELVDYDESDVLGRGFNTSSSVKLKDLKNLPELNSEPFQKRRTVGLHRVSLLENN
jgi:hypothetical protein